MNAYWRRPLSNLDSRINDKKVIYRKILKLYVIFRLDLLGSLLWWTGEAFKRNADESIRNLSDDSVLIRRGISYRNPHLENLRELRMNVVSTEKLGLQNTLQKIYGNRLKISLEPVKIKY